MQRSDVAGPSLILFGERFRLFCVAMSEVNELAKLKAEGVMYERTFQDLEDEARVGGPISYFQLFVAHLSFQLTNSTFFFPQFQGANNANQAGRAVISHLSTCSAACAAVEAAEVHWGVHSKQLDLWT